MCEWKNWKTRGKKYIKEDPHHAEIINIHTGEVVSDMSMYSMYSTYKRYRDKQIHRNDVGDAFCTTDWSRH